MKTILVVDDQADVVNSYRRVFEHEGFAIEIASNEEGISKIIQSDRKPDIVLLDIDLKGDGQDQSGLKILEKLRLHWPKPMLPIIIVSGAGDTSLLINTIQNKGANDYLIQPIDDYQGLLDMVNRFLEADPGTSEIALVKERIIGKTKRMMGLTKEILNAAQHDCDTLILGPTGTGKDLIAKTYHELSRRSAAPFYLIHCPGIPKDLAESELFGYEGKSFTNADPQGKKGKIESANGGIVFFNEIGDLSYDHQSKILRFLESKEIMRIGSTKKIKLDVTVLAATNCDLQHMIQQGEFRKDLYYRFSNVIFSPPLKEHIEDIPLLVNHFLAKANARWNTKIQSVDKEVMERFMQVEKWDGNVRHLENCINYGVIHCKGHKIFLEDVEPYLAKGIRYEKVGVGYVPVEKNFDLNYDEFNQFLAQETTKLEREYYSYHLKKHHNNVTKTAEALKIKSRPQLYPILKRLGIILDEE